MSVLTVGAAAIAVFAAGALVQAATIEVGELGSPRRWAVECASPSLGEALVQALVEDGDLLWRGHPRAPRDAFVIALRERAEAALQHAGYADARVEVRLEANGESPAGSAGPGTQLTSKTPVIPADKSRPAGRLTLRVREGQRFIAGDVKISGVDAPLERRLRERLTSPLPPSGAIAETKTVGGAKEGKKTIEWRTADGQAAELSPPLWKAGEGAPFDRATREQTRRVAAQVLAEEGCDAARFMVNVRRGTGNQAHLELRVVEIGPVSVIREVTLVDPKTAPRHNAELLKSYLKIKTGERVTELDVARWRRQLIESGRFRKSDVELKWRVGGGSVEARFALEELPGTPPLGQPLTREQQAVLRCRDWILDWRTHQHDWVVERVRTSGETTSRWIVSPEQGATVEYGLGQDAPVTWAASPAGLGCYLPDAGVCWRVPTTGRTQIAGNLSVLFRDGDGAQEHPHALTVGVGYRSLDPGVVAPPLRMDVRIDPAVVLSSWQQSPGDRRFEGDELQWTKDGSTLRIDARTGRLVELVIVDDQGQWRVTTAPQAFAKQMATLARQPLQDQFDAQAPLSSACRFFGEPRTWEALVQLEQELGLSAAAADMLAGDDAQIEPRGAAVAQLLRRCAEGGLLTRFDQAIVALNDKQERKAGLRLIVPKPPETTGDPQSLRELAGLLMRLADLAFDREEWPSTLLRAGAGMLAGETKYLQYDVTRMYVSKEVGPIGFLTGSAVIPVPVMAATFAQEGRSRLKSTDFKHDRDLLLRLLDRTETRDTLVALLRSLDDAQVAQLGAWCWGDEASFRPLVQTLRAAPTAAEAARQLPEALDAWFEQSLRTCLEAKLRERSSLETARLPGAAR
ncbi:MAG: hypothetical protein U0939_13340 [Pirellulales bacterium]